MHSSSAAARRILANFIVNNSGTGRRSEDGLLEAILLEHLLLQAGFKIVGREPDEHMLLAGFPPATPEDVWRGMWDAAGDNDTDVAEAYTPA